jgi:hypothetical protein
MELKRAQRKQAKIRLNLSAPSGGGKTYGALLLAKGLAGDWSKVVLIDTENKSASLYDHLGEFNVIDLSPDFTPEKYIAAIKMGEDAGMSVIVIDSTTHEWACLIEENQLLADTKFRGNSWSAWSVTTPRHDRFLNAILQSKCHIITCTRSKTDTVMGEDKKVRKVGLKDMQRDGWEYELTVSLTIDRDSHMAIASKDRTNLFEGTKPFKITEKTGELIRDWCEKGKEIDAKDVLTKQHPQYGNVVTALSGNYTMPQIAAKYTVSEEVKEQLINDVMALKTKQDGTAS